jgi:hypothetical protein
MHSMGLDAVKYKEVQNHISCHRTALYTAAPHDFHNNVERGRKVIGTLN